MRLVVSASLLLALSTVSAAPAADAPTISGDPLSIILQYGTLGIVVLGFITGWIVPGPTAKQLVEENRRLNLLITETLIPLIEKTTTSLEGFTQTSGNVTEAINAVRQELHDFQRGK
jgi:hypothetical protein